MKNFKYTLVAGLAAIASFSSCEDYLNVQPKSQVLADEFFVDDQAYNDFLTGVYEKMTSSSLYGRELTYGLLSVLEQDYDIPTNHVYYEASQYHYLTDASTRSAIDAIWSQQYNCIAQLNLMLQYIDQTPASVFDGENYSLYKGEALGLRAFLHLDLLRLFSPACTSEAGAAAIPYVTTYGTELTPQKTVSETLQLIKADLKQARQLLSKGDKLYLANSDDAYYYRGSNRGYYGQQIFNYYAATATLARAYMWENKLDSAYIYANEVVESVDNGDYKFSWVHTTAATATNLVDRDLIYSSEHIFRMGINKMDDQVKNYFTATAKGNGSLLTPSETMRDQIYEVSAKGYGIDWRYNYGYIYDGDTYPYMAKYRQVENGAYNNMIPLIRISEMYYTCAEAKAASDKARACEVLNTVRNARNLTEAYNLDPTALSTQDIKDEIWKEYRKELLGEGQLFYYYKRLNYTSIPGAAGSAGRSVYVLPYPDNEVEFGNRKQ